MIRNGGMCTDFLSVKMVMHIMTMIGSVSIRDSTYPRYIPMAVRAMVSSRSAKYSPLTNLFRLIMSRSAMFGTAGWSMGSERRTY